jgi:hypothetical protein
VLRSIIAVGRIVRRDAAVYFDNLVVAIIEVTLELSGVGIPA